MEVSFIEKLCPTFDYPNGLHPGFEKINDRSMKTPEINLYQWLRSTFIFEEDLDEDGYIKPSFFERRKEIFENSLDNWENSLDNWRSNKTVGYYFDGKVYTDNIDKSEVIESMLTVILINYRFSDLLYIPENYGIPIDFYFELLAYLLLTRSHIKLKEESFSFLEIEFYYRSPSHLDPYSHCSNDQKEGGNWAFHKTGKSYRSGTFKGLDITLGNINREKEKINSYGGILIRSLYNYDSQKIICGPCLCVDEFLRLTEKSSIGEFVEDEKFNKKINTPGANLISIYWETRPMEDFRIQRSVRIGLNLNKKTLISNGMKTDLDKEIQREFVSKSYRYFGTNNKLSKGRTHGIVEMIREGRSNKEIKKIFGSTNIDKVRNNYDQGKNIDIEDFYDRKLEDKDLPFVLGYIDSQN